MENYGSDCHISGKLQVSGAQCLRPSRQGMPSRQGKKRAEKQTLLPLEVYSRCIRDTAWTNQLNMKKMSEVDWKLNCLPGLQDSVRLEVRDFETRVLAARSASILIQMIARKT